MIRITPVILALTALAWLTPELAAQERSHRFDAVPQIPTPAADTDGWGFGEQATFSVLGSAVGLFAGAAVAYGLMVGDGCEGLGCAVLPFAVGGTLGSVLGASAGVHLFGWATDTPVEWGSTLAGAALGVVGGALVGAAAAAVVSSEATFFIGYTVTQGTLTALVSARQ